MVPIMVQAVPLVKDRASIWRIVLTDGVALEIQFPEKHR